MEGALDDGKKATLGQNENALPSVVPNGAMSTVAAMLGFTIDGDVDDNDGGNEDSRLSMRSSSSSHGSTKKEITLREKGKRHDYASDFEDIDDNRSDEDLEGFAHVHNSYGMTPKRNTERKWHDEGKISEANRQHRQVCERDAGGIRKGPERRRRKQWETSDSSNIEDGLVPNLTKIRPSRMDASEQESSSDLNGSFKITSASPSQLREMQKRSGRRRWRAAEGEHETDEDNDASDDKSREGNEGSAGETSVELSGGHREERKVLTQTADVRVSQTQQSFLEWSASGTDAMLAMEPGDMVQAAILRYGKEQFV